MTVADRIRFKREELNLSQEELAKKIGNKDKSTISKIEKSGNDITMKNIQRIADALGVSSQYLLGWEDVPEFEYETENATIVKKNKNEDEARKLYELYQQADPSIKAAIETLLKGNREN